MNTPQIVMLSGNVELHLCQTICAEAPLVKAAISGAVTVPDVPCLLTPNASKRPSL